jgi:zinc-finger-containing domain
MQLTEIQDKIFKGKVCPYCKQPSEFVNSRVIYGRDYGMIYLCKPCGAYVGVHKNTNEALGRLANSDLRYWKKEAHAYFDLIWIHKFLTRSEAYSWLSTKLNLPAEYTHIGMFSVKTCKDVVYYSKQILNDLRRLDLDCGDEPKTPYYENPEF